MTFLQTGTKESRRSGGLQLIALGVLAGSLLSASQASAQVLTTLVDFNYSNGANPYAGLLADANGNLFGTTSSGGTGFGTVFELAKTPTGYAATPTTLATFSYSDGAVPDAELLADAKGNLFGTTYGGGAFGAGTVFELAKTATGYASSVTSLVSFNGSNGSTPYAGLIADGRGNLLGTTHLGGSFGAGTIFEIAKTASGYAATPTTMFNFNNSTGGYPFGGLVADNRGNLFGTTSSSASAYGTVFELARTGGGYAGAATTLVNFSYSDGAVPYAALILDGKGNLFGTTYGGGAFGAGTVFEVAKTATGYAAAPTALVSFSHSNGATPYAKLIADMNGNLFGTTLLGGSSGAGTVFKLAKTATGYAAAPIVLANFNGANGAYPVAGLIAGTNGHLLGTAYSGGAAGYGTVFELSRSGFVKFAGVPDASNCHSVTIAALTTEYGSVANAASGLGYASVPALQNAIANYCDE